MPYNLGMRVDPFAKFTTRAMIKNERFDSLLTAENIRSIDNMMLIQPKEQALPAGRWQNAYIRCLEIVEDMAMHGVPREFFASAIKAIQLSAPLAHHVTYKNSEAIEVWNEEAKTGEILRII